jgi:hypothetical protein
MPDEAASKKAKLENSEEASASSEQSENPELKETTQASKEAADRLAQPGALEVEEMPESGELEERRKRMRGLIQESTDVSDAEGGGLVGDPFESGGGFMDLLREANLSPRHLRFCCGGVFLLIFLLLIIFGAFRLAGWIQDRPVRLTEPEVEEELTFSITDPSIDAAVLVGTDEADLDDGVNTSQIIGEQFLAHSTYSRHVAEFADMYESMRVDVNELLDLSRDRQRTYNEYHAELDAHFFTGRRNKEALESEITRIQTQFASSEASKEALELEFFERLNQLDSFGSVVSLNAFITEAEVVVRLRAESQAREKLLALYDELLPLMEARLRDLGFNEEALVKGIRIIDVEGSDIDLILEDESL